jgi:hypothetical protein
MLYIALNVYFATTKINVQHYKKIISGSAPNELVPVKSRLRILFTPTTKIIGVSNTSDSRCGSSGHMPYNLNLSLFQQFPMDRTKEFSI